MINLIGILSLLVVLATFVVSVILFFVNKSHLSDNEVAERDRELGLRTETIRGKNATIMELVKRIEELEDENKQLKKELQRTNNKRLRQNS